MALNISAAARPTRGVKFICRAPAGSNSIRQTASSAIVDLIRVAVARDPGQAVPLSGTYLGNVEDELDMRVEVNVKCETDAEISTALAG